MIVVRGPSIELFLLVRRFHGRLQEVVAVVLLWDWVQEVVEEVEDLHMEVDVWEVVMTVM
jgi:hypothetical protein